MKEWIAETTDEYSDEEIIEIISYHHGKVKNICFGYHKKYYFIEIKRRDSIKLMNEDKILHVFENKRFKY